MKIPKKIWIGCGLLTLFLSVFLSHGTGKVLALSASDFQQPPASYNLVGTSSISAELGSGVTVTFDNNVTNPTAKNLVFTPTSSDFSGGQFCSGSKITTPNTTPVGSTAQINVKWVNTGSKGSCNSNPPFVGPQTYSAQISLTTAGVPPAGGGNTDTNSSCEASSGTFSLSWLMCPLLLAAQDFSGKLINLFEGQLSFTVSKNLGNSTTQSQVKSTWVIIRNIASAILVIVMLVMIISQAVGGGPLDAYTVRKLLPRLVAIAILMQISWYLVAWIIDIFNDLGRGIGDIMMAPFGGSANLKLVGLLTHAHIPVYENAAINWVAIIALIGLAIAALPTVLALAFGAAIALLFGLLVLVFRKVLIIMLLILSPLALAMWILPGTQRYGKLWSDNLIKILGMYPILVAIISAGRIFAYVVGTQDNGTFINLIFILVGFFGPLFVLHKTFNWGGGIMSQAGKAVMDAGSKMSEAGKKPISEQAGLWQGKWARQYNPLDNEKRKILGVNVPVGATRRGFRRLQSGHFLPTERSRRLTLAAGAQWAGERNEEASAFVSRSYEKALTEGYDKHLVDENGNFVAVRRDADGNMLDAQGNTVTSWRNAEITYRGGDQSRGDVQRVFGVEAGKQALVDITGMEGSDANNRAAQAAHKMLLDTHSEIELQSARIQRDGKNQGKRFTEVESFRDTMENSPQHYSAVIQRRPDQAPDVIESAFSKTRDNYEEAYKAKDPAEKAARIKAIDKARLETAISRLSPDALASAHYGFFQDIARMEDKELSKALADTIVKFKTQGGVVGANAVGSLRGGKEQYVDAALRIAGASLDDLPSSTPSQPAAPPVETTIETPPSAGAVVEPGTGEVQIRHAPPPGGSGWSAPPEFPPEPQQPPGPPSNNPPQS